jgi:aldehyde:ferredoxin oxidoreductase
MGGGAMGMAYILRETPPGLADPQYFGALQPENLLTIMTSVTTGAAISGQSRININAKSPMSGAIGDSQAGGFFPAELKFAGFDGILVRGRSSKPVYLSILHGKAELHDASHLMGKITGEVDGILKQEVGDPKAEVMQTGPAAEKGISYSSVVNMASRHNGRRLTQRHRNQNGIVHRAFLSGSGARNARTTSPRILGAAARRYPHIHNPSRA